MNGFDLLILEIDDNVTFGLDLFVCVCKKKR
jgi:hypothetical protein